MNKNEESVVVEVPKKPGLVFQVQTFPGTDFWIVVEKGELSEIVRKARLFDIEQQRKRELAPENKKWYEV